MLAKRSMSHDLPNKHSDPHAVIILDKIKHLENNNEKLKCSIYNLPNYEESTMKLTDSQMSLEKINVTNDMNHTNLIGLQHLIIKYLKFNGELIKNIHEMTIEKTDESKPSSNQMTNDRLSEGLDKLMNNCENIGRIVQNLNKLENSNVTIKSKLETTMKALSIQTECCVNKIQLYAINHQQHIVIQLLSHIKELLNRHV